jgi:hypothetical protein
LRTAEGLREEIDTWHSMTSRADDLLELASLAEESADSVRASCSPDRTTSATRS